MGSGFAKYKKQAKMMQEQLSKIQQQMKETTIEGSSGGGLVTLWINGEKEMQKIVIKPECVDPQDIEGLQDLILAAQKDALLKLEQNSSLLPHLGSFGF